MDRIGLVILVLLIKLVSPATVFIPSTITTPSTISTASIITKASTSTSATSTSATSTSATSTSATSTSATSTSATSTSATSTSATSTSATSTSATSTSATSTSAASTSTKHEDLQSSRYQVTENVVDIPDDRTLPPVISNFTLVLPLNYGNNSAVNKVKESEVEENDGVNNLKKNSFSILHIKGEYDNQPVPVQHHKNVFTKFLGGLRDYVYNLKRGVVDGLHTFVHRHEKPDGEEFHDKFHRNFHGLEDLDHKHDYYDQDHEDDDSTEYFGDY